MRGRVRDPVRQKKERKKKEPESSMMPARNTVIHTPTNQSHHKLQNTNNESHSRSQPHAVCPANRSTSQPASQPGRD